MKFVKGDKIKIWNDLHLYREIIRELQTHYGYLIISEDGIFDAGGSDFYMIVGCESIVRSSDLDHDAELYSLIQKPKQFKLNPNEV
jgi:hypothetical protein